MPLLRQRAGKQDLAALFDLDPTRKQKGEAQVCMAHVCHPLQFGGGFFIVVAVANSLEAEKKSNPRLASTTDFGMVSGIGWRIAQVLSFVPGLVGQAAGLLGMVLVV